MEIKNVIKLACLFLGKDDYENLSSLGGTQTETDAETKDLNFLLRCLNLTYQEIASDYIPLFATDTVETSSGKIVFSKLTKKLNEIKSVSENGFRVKYMLYPDYIKTDAKTVDITYSYLPAELTTLTSTLETFTNKVSEMVLAYGTAMEYCFISGLYDDATMWEKRFKDALEIKAAKKSEKKLPNRRWI